MNISHTETEGRKRKKIKLGTSTAEHTGPFGKTLEAEPMKSVEMTEIAGTSAAAEHSNSGERTQWPTNSIFRAPAHIRSVVRESYFKPKLVSIGPYYHGQENLKRMEDLKLRCIPEILMKQGTRNHPPSEAGPHRRRSIYNMPIKPSTQGEKGIKLFEIYQQFTGLGKKARAYYKDEFDQNLENENFVKMLFFDSCFIIRIIFALFQPVQESMAFLDVNIKEVRSDLLLLENQIPLFFIRKVYEWLFPHTPNPKLPPFNVLLESFICLDMPWRFNHGAISSEAVHLLDLYWRCSLSPTMYQKLYDQERDLSQQEGDLSDRETHHSEHEHEHPTWEQIYEFSNTKPMVIANATELHKTAGVEFEKFKNENHLDVIFRNGIMWMPRLKIDSRQINLLINLIAFENCMLPSMRTISYYMKVMDALIDSAKDVELLQKSGVIYNTLMSHEAAAYIFNEIGNCCFIDDNRNPFSGLYKDVQKYYNSSWHRRWASLQQNYFSSPWAVISVIAGVILLLLSALQTFYTVYGYYHQKNGSPETESNQSQD